MRIGRKFKKMAKKLPEFESNLLWSKRDAERVYEGFTEKFKVADELKARIEEKAFLVVKKARENGERARFTWHACHDTSCAICGGTQPEHFHLSVEGNRGINLEEWLANYLSAEEVLAFISLIKNRENLLVLLHYETILLRNLGLLED